MRRRLIIAIDGPTAAGKSTAGRELARRLGYLYIDTGAMYRAVALRALEDRCDLDDAERLALLAETTRIGLAGDPSHVTVTIDGRDVTGAIRAPAVDAAASAVSTVPGVRAALVEQQRALGRGGGVVLDGRDIGTNVFPDADVKFFLRANPTVRAERRRDEYATRGREESLATTLAALEERDRRDESRALHPLRPAPDAVVLDSSALSPEGVIEKMLEIVRTRL